MAHFGVYMTPVKVRGGRKKKGSIKLQLGKLRVDRPSAGAHHQYYMGGETKKVQNNVCVAW